MRLLSILKATPRSLILPPLFGVVLGLVVMASHPGSSSADDSVGVVQEFANHKCTGDVTCASIGPVLGNPSCLLGVECVFSQTNPFSTCRPLADNQCINSQNVYGFTTCSGSCQHRDGGFCSMPVYHCAQGPSGG